MFPVPPCRSCQSRVGATVTKPLRSRRRGPHQYLCNQSAESTVPPAAPPRGNLGRCIAFPILRWLSLARVAHSWRHSDSFNSTGPVQLPVGHSLSCRLTMGGFSLGGLGGSSGWRLTQGGNAEIDPTHLVPQTKKSGKSASIRPSATRTFQRGSDE